MKKRMKKMKATPKRSDYIFFLFSLPYHPLNLFTSLIDRDANDCSYQLGAVLSWTEAWKNASWRWSAGRAASRVQATVELIAAEYVK